MHRILFLHHSSNIGGGSYCLLNIIKALDKSIWEPVAALKTRGPLADAMMDIGIEVVLFPDMVSLPYNETLLKPANVAAYIKASKRHISFREFLLRECIEVVYINNMMLAPYLKDAKEAGCKTVMHVREHWPLNKHKKQLDWIRDIVYNNCNCLIAINNYSASIFPKKKTTIVYDWIDMESRHKNLSMSNIFKEDVSDKKILLFTGGQSIIKGTNYVVDTFSKQITGNEYRLLILGIDKLKVLSGWKHWLKLLFEHFGYYYYDKHIQDLLRSDYRIKYIPPIYEISDIIKQSHCFVSYFSIPHANLALAENIILGNPCIAADTEEAREYSGDGKYAKLVTFQKRGIIFSQELNDFIKNIEKWQEAAKKGSKPIAEMFNPQKNIELLKYCLNQLIYNHTS